MCGFCNVRACLCACMCVEGGVFVIKEIRQREITRQFNRKYYTKINILLLHNKSGYKYEVFYVY